MRALASVDIIKKCDEEFCLQLFSRFLVPFCLSLHYASRSLFLSLFENGSNSPLDHSTIKLLYFMHFCHFSLCLSRKRITSGKSEQKKKWNGQVVTAKGKSNRKIRCAISQTNKNKREWKEYTQMWNEKSFPQLTFAFKKRNGKIKMSVRTLEKTKTRREHIQRISNCEREKERQWKRAEICAHGKRR